MPVPVCVYVYVYLCVHIIYMKIYVGESWSVGWIRTGRDVVLALLLLCQPGLLILAVGAVAWRR